jgi:hypothetical protein
VSCPGHFLPPGKTRYPLYRRLGGPQGRSGQVRKISPPPGFDPWTVQPVVSRYTDWATGPTLSWIYIGNKGVHLTVFTYRPEKQINEKVWSIKTHYSIRGGIENILDWCRHLYRSCGSAKHRCMVGLPCLVSQCTKLHIARWKWAVFTRVYLESCTWPVTIFTMDHRKELRMCIKFCDNLGKCYRDTHNDSTNLQGPNLEPYADVSMACPVQDRSHISWRPTHTETHKLYNSWNCCMNSRACPSESTSDHSRHCWGGGSWLWDMPTGSDKRTGHAQCCSFTMTMPHLTIPSSPSSFWQNKWVSSPTHCTPLIWHPVTSSYFQKWNWSWKDTSLIPLRISKPNCSVCFTVWQKRTSRKHSKNGDGGTGVYIQEGITLRVIAANRPNGEFYDFYIISSEYSGASVYELNPFLKAVRKPNCS